MGSGENGLVGAARGHGELDTADADGDESADLEELTADGAAGGVGEFGRLQAEQRSLSRRRYAIEANHKRS